MTRAFVVRGTLLDLIEGGTVVATLPCASESEAQDFGMDYVERDAARRRSREHHPAGRRLAE